MNGLSERGCPKWNIRTCLAQLTGTCKHRSGAIKCDMRRLKQLFLEYFKEQADRKTISNCAWLISARGFTSVQPFEHCCHLSYQFGCVGTKTRVWTTLEHIKLTTKMGNGKTKQITVNYIFKISTYQLLSKIFLQFEMVWNHFKCVW